ncbi:MAG TPA: DUF192 domain-containing protein [Caulobacteraceae bacterium]|jgi:hypothetical protein
MTIPVRRTALSLPFILALILALPVTSTATSAPAPLRIAPLDIVTDRGDFHFRVEVADTAASRERGLMYRKSLAADRGMIFDFKTSQVVAFWMKNTLIPLDMLFIGADGRIVSIARNARPMDETAVPSGAPVLAVLELRGGRAAEIDAEPGDRVREAIFPR